MAGSAILSIKILTDASGAQKGLDSAASSMDKFKSGIQKAAVPAALVGAAILKFGTDAVKSASRTQQAMGGVDAVFGNNAKTVKRWADGAATSIGVAKSEYGELATVIGSQLKNAGLPLDTVTKKTHALIQKGADLAAMFGGTTADAVSALSSAMKGEFDPMEKYGTSLSAAKIAAQQAAEGTDKLKGKQADQAKALATLHLIQKQTASSSGAAAREQDTYAARTQQFAAEIENLKSDLGTALLPIVAKVVDKFAGLAGWMSQNIGLVQTIVGIIAGLVGIILILNAAMKIAAIIQWAMNAAWLANPVVLVVLAIVALVAIVVIAYNKVGWFHDFVDKVFAAMKSTVQALGTVFANVWNGTKTTVTNVMQAIRAVWDNVTGALRSAWSNTVGAIKTVWSAAVDMVRTAMGNVRETWANVVSAVRSAWSNTVGAIREAAGNLRDAVINVWHAIRDAVGTVTGAIRDGLVGAVDRVKGVMSGLGAILSAPFNVAKDAVNGIKSAIQGVIDAVNNLIGALSRIHVPKISLPHIPGTTAATSYAAPAPALRTARTAGTAAGTPAAAGGTVINVYGAIDPEGTARTIRRVLEGHDRRVGLRVS